MKVDTRTSGEDGKAEREKRSFDERAWKMNTVQPGWWKKPRRREKKREEGRREDE